MISRPSYRALVVDDEPIVRQATIRALSHCGFTCEAAADGRGALEMARQSRFDVVVTDLRMPEANGHRLAVDLLEMPNRPAIVVLTGVLEPKISNDLQARGVDEILYKPVDFGLLAKKVTAAVEKRLPQTPLAPSPAATATEPSTHTSNGGASAPSDHTPSARQASAPVQVNELAREFEKLRRAVATAEQKAALRSLIIFFAGLFVGWLLSWVGPGAAWVR